MSAIIHIKTTVLPNGKIEIDAPNIPPGTTVTVTIEQEANALKRHVVDILATIQGHRLFKTAEEVDAYIREERDAWE